jgi:hypothetical protein
VLDLFAAANALHNRGHFVFGSWRQQHPDRLPNGFGRRVPIDPFRAMVPADDRGVEGLSNDGVF